MVRCVYLILFLASLFIANSAQGQPPQQVPNPNYTPCYHYDWSNLTCQAALASTPITPCSSCVASIWTWYYSVCQAKTQSQVNDPTKIIITGVVTVGVGSNGMPTRNQGAVICGITLDCGYPSTYCVADPNGNMICPQRTTPYTFEPVPSLSGTCVGQSLYLP